MCIRVTSDFVTYCISPEYCLLQCTNRHKTVIDKNINIYSMLCSHLCHPCDTGHHGILGFVTSPTAYFIFHFQTDNKYGHNVEY